MGWHGSGPPWETLGPKSPLEDPWENPGETLGDTGGPWGDPWEKQNNAIWGLALVSYCFMLFHFILIHFIPQIALAIGVLAVLVKGP